MQAEGALQSLRNELPCLSEGERGALDQSEAPDAKRDSSDRLQPEQAAEQGWGGAASCTQGLTGQSNLYAACLIDLSTSLKYCGVHTACGGCSNE